MAKSLGELIQENFPEGFRDGEMDWHSHPPLGEYEGGGTRHQHKDGDLPHRHDKANSGGGQYGDRL